jgi:hypothetical protein
MFCMSIEEYIPRSFRTPLIPSVQFPATSLALNTARLVEPEKRMIILDFSRIRVGEFGSVQSLGSMHVRIFSRRYSSSRSP